MEKMQLPGGFDGKISLWTMIAHADLVVQAVMLVLVLLSIWVWAVIFDKSMRVRRLQARATKFEEAFWSGGSLEDLYERVGNRPRDPMAAIFASAMREWRRSTTKGLGATEAMRAALHQRIERVMSVTLAREMEQLERFMTTMATIGSAAPFLGLFGTVWGIMNSFQSIAVTKNTTLAVVAPGIAEALFATALGLVAAIPAVIAYNKLSGEVDRYADRLDSFSEEFTVVLSRELDSSRVA